MYFFERRKFVFHKNIHVTWSMLKVVLFWTVLCIYIFPELFFKVQCIVLLIVYIWHNHLPYVFKLKMSHSILTCRNVLPVYTGSLMIKKYVMMSNLFMISAKCMQNDIQMCRVYILCDFLRNGIWCQIICDFCNCLW